MKPDDPKMARVLAGEADAEEVELLLAELKADPELARRFARLAEIEGLIGPALEDDLRRERRLQQVMTAVREADREGFVGEVQRRIRVGQASRRALAAAAAVVVGLFLWKSFGPAARPSFIATIERTESLKSAQPVEVGSGLVKGEALVIDSGLAELKVGNQGTMIVEGPAHLSFEEEKRAVLTRGRVVMRVTEAGHGYRLETPLGSVIDLGTEFGVAVTDDGEVETHVLDGEVEAVPNSGPKMRLTKAKALRFGEETPMAADGSAFYTKLPPAHRDLPKGITWSFDEGEGMLSRSTPEDYPMVFYARGQGQGPEWSDGVFGRAIDLDGRGAYMESSYRGVAGGDPRTVCFWVKVPEDFSRKQGFGIVSWGRWRDVGYGEVWQLSVNPLSEDGPIGRLRVGLHGGQIIGSTDLRDGQWHHVAVVLFEASQPDIGTHVVVYVDGELEGISRRSLLEIRTEVESASHGVWVGRNVTTEGGRDVAHGAFFRGGVDELAIYEGALNQDEIQSLIAEGRLPVE